MIPFNSIIVLDTETTSLPQMDHNTTKVTEMAVLGCEIDHLRDSSELPRVLHKLVFLFNPMKIIHPDASRVSGLFNELLMNIKPFQREDAEVLSRFISRLPPPVCIVAHNGNKFDFPILRSALKSVNKNLPNDVYCIDSLEAFKKLLPIALNSLSHQGKEEAKKSETTPKHQRTQPINSLNYKNVARELQFSDNDILTPDSKCTTEVMYRPKTYRLKDVYCFFFGTSFPNAHRAEHDSQALLNCIMRCDGFLDWMGKNAVEFNSIKPLF